MGRNSRGIARAIFGCRLLVTLVAIAALTSSLGLEPVGAQVVINEVLADNRSTSPVDIGGGTPDMVELLNRTDDAVVLGTGVPATSWVLTDTESLEDVAEAEQWVFPASRSTIPGGGRLVIFCDGDIPEGTCELHAAFGISSDGSEPISLWGPRAVADDPLSRPLIDRVWLPPLRSDVSFGRAPDGAGPAPVPVEETFEHFAFYPPVDGIPTATFGLCATTNGACVLGLRRFCGGSPNPAEGSNSVPRVTRSDQSTNAPAADEPVEITARVRDDQVPTPVDEGGSIARVELVYRVFGVDGSPGEEQAVEMTWDGDVHDGADASPPRPLDISTLWHGLIPGQEAGTRVEFYLRTVDDGGAIDTQPGNFCSDLESPVEGPCDRAYGPPEFGCQLDLVDVVECASSDDEEDVVLFQGERYIACNVPWSYAVGYEPDPARGLDRLVINEIVPRQSDLLTDETEFPCTSFDGCPPENPDCCKRDEDFIEIYNGSSITVDLSGCWLSDNFFSPREWQFPPGSEIAAGTYAIVWLDDDGSKCPDGTRLDRPCWWECPDPNAVEPNPQRWHTNFAINADGDQIFLFDNAENGFGLIHGLDFGDPSSFPGFTEDEPCRDPETLEIVPCPDPVTGEPMVGPQGEPLGRNSSLAILANQSLSLTPEGDRNGCWVVAERGTPNEANVVDATCAVQFKRGDANGNGGVDLSDAVATFGFLFTGGDAPTCYDAADSNDSGSLDLSDGIYTLNWLFGGGDAPADPGATCGPDPTEDDLLACEYSECP